MADRILFVGWNTPISGAEERSLEVFNDALGILGRMQQDGRIERFEVALLEPNSDLGGFLSIHGTADQIAAVKVDAEFQRNTIDATLCVNGMRHIDGYADEGIAPQMAMYQEALSQVPQRA